MVVNKADIDYSTVDPNNIVGILAKALLDRRNGIHNEFVRLFLCLEFYFTHGQDMGEEDEEESEEEAWDD